MTNATYKKSDLQFQKVRVYDSRANTWGQEHLRAHILTHNYEAQLELTGNLWNLRAWPQWHTSFKKATPLILPNSSTNYLNMSI